MTTTRTTTPRALLDSAIRSPSPAESPAAREDAVGGGIMTRRRAAVATPEKPRPTLFDTSASKQPFMWGMWPAPDARLAISGVPGVWAFRGGIEYGHIKAVALVAWDDRANVMAEWRVAPLVAVSVEIEAAS